MTERDLGSERIDIGKRIIAFIGPEGSGKTDNAKLLAVQSGKPYISTHDLLDEVKENDPGFLGDKVREMFANHTYLAGDLLLQIINNRFIKDDTQNGFILDGGFRTVEETMNFEKTLERAGRNLPITVIYLNIPIETSFERLINGDGSQKRGRKEDTFEGVKSRLEKFNYRLEERLNIIKSNPNWDLIEIDATPSKNDVYKDICNSVGQA